MIIKGGFKVVQSCSGARLPVRFSARKTAGEVSHESRGNLIIQAGKFILHTA